MPSIDNTSNIADSSCAPCPQDHKYIQAIYTKQCIIIMFVLVTNRTDNAKMEKFDKYILYILVFNIRTYFPTFDLCNSNSLDKRCTGTLNFFFYIKPEFPTQHE